MGAASDTERMGGSVLRVCGALLGLLLSLTFASVQSKLGKLRDAVELEAAQIVDIHNDLGQFESDKASEAQAKVVAYADALINREWQALANDRLDERAQELFNEIQLRILDLETTTGRQESLRSNLIQDIDEISDHRQARLHHATTDTPIFLYIALFGFLIVSALFAVHPTGKVPSLLFSFYAAFFGVVLYFIMEMNDPFQGMVRVSADPVKVVYKNLLSELN